MWNSTLFPDAQAFTQWLHDRGLKVIVNTHDYSGIDHCQGDVYAAAAAIVGQDPASNVTIPCNIQNKTYATALLQAALLPLTNGSSSSIDWFWTDWGKDAGVWYGFHSHHSVFCNILSMYRCPADTGAQPMLWSNYVHHQLLQQQGKRGLVLTPYGGLGNHRFPQVGSGDTDVAYATLEFQVYQTATAANVLTHWTHDLGGFHQSSFVWPTPELWLRWLQV